MEYIKPLQIIKIVLAGQYACGKSSLLMKYMDNEIPQKIESTIVQDIKIVTQEDEKTIYKIQVFYFQKVQKEIWDTAGQDKFQSFASSYYLRAKGVMIVIDQSKDLNEEMKNISIHLQKIKEFAPDNSKKILIANKQDLCDRDKTEQLSKIAKEYNMPFIQTSAITGLNVKAAFDQLIDTIKTDSEFKVCQNKESQVITEQTLSQISNQQQNYQTQQPQWDKSCCQ